MQALFQDAGVAESTVISQRHGKGVGHILLINLVGRGKDDRKQNTLAQLAEPILSLLAAGARICKPFKAPRNRFLGP